MIFKNVLFDDFDWMLLSSLHSTIVMSEILLALREEIFEGMDIFALGNFELNSKSEISVKNIFNP